MFIFALNVHMRLNDLVGTLALVVTQNSCASSSLNALGVLLRKKKEYMNLEWTVVKICPLTVAILNGG